jgi:hypothetical protein
MRHPITFFYRGRDYTAREIALTFAPSLPVSLVQARLYRGCTVEEAIAPKVSRKEAGRRGKAASIEIARRAS